MQWFAQVDGQIYGPYDDNQMQDFVAEGRINGQSLISNNPSAGFFPAIGYDVFSLWSGTGQAAQVSGGYSQYSPQSYGAHSQAEQQARPSTVTPFRRTEAAPTAQSTQHASEHQFVIMAEINSDSLMGFLQRLQTFGQAERVGETVWILKSAHSTETLRNALSQTLTRQDRLFIVDSAENKTAWFNIGADLDKRIRGLWDEDPN